MALPWCIYMHTKRQDLLNLLEATSVTRGYSKPGLINNYLVLLYNYNKLIWILWHYFPNFIDEQSGCCEP